MNNNSLTLINGGQDQGGRDYQEDSYNLWSHSDTSYLIVMCDGMGGHAGGAQASSIALNAFAEQFMQKNEMTTTQKLQSSLDFANSSISKSKIENPEYNKMGTTLVGVDIQRNKLRWISVGDSPMWLLRKGRLTKLNADHSMAEVFKKLVEIGNMSAEDAATDPARNGLRSAVTGDELKLIDLPEQEFILENGDSLVVASDGLDTLSETQIISLITPDAEETVKNLLNKVKEIALPNQDNVSVVCFNYKSKEPVLVATSDLGEAVTQDDSQKSVINKALKTILATAVLVLIALLVFVDFSPKSAVKPTVIETAKKKPLPEETTKKKDTAGTKQNSPVSSLPVIKKPTTTYGHLIEPNMIKINAGNYQSSPPLATQAQISPKSTNTPVATFYLAQTEATWAQYAQCEKEQVCSSLETSGWEQDDSPVMNITYSQVQTYIGWLNNKTHKNYALPSELQWRYAYQKGGQSLLVGSQQNKTQAVKTMRPNSLDIYGLQGNVAEWVLNCNVSTTHSNIAQICSQFVAMGYSWQRPHPSVQPVNQSLQVNAIQKVFSATYKSNSLGFRLALPATPTSKVFSLEVEYK